MSDCCSGDAETGNGPAVMICPVNGARSKQVEILTVKSLVRKLPLGMPNTQYYFCEAQDCDVVYFPLDAKAPSFRREDLLVRVSAKENGDALPICYCFGFSRKDVQDEITQPGRVSIADLITTEVKAGNCACELKNPSGKCCLGNIARVAQDAATEAKGAT